MISIILPDDVSVSERFRPTAAGTVAE